MVLEDKYTNKTKIEANLLLKIISACSLGSGIDQFEGTFLDYF